MLFLLVRRVALRAPALSALHATPCLTRSFGIAGPVLYPNSNKETVTTKPTKASVDEDAPKKAKPAKKEQSATKEKKPTARSAKKVAGEDVQPADMSTQELKKHMPPKRPSTPYFLFQTHSQPTEVKSLLEQRAFTRESGQRWKALSDEEKKPYEEEYLKAREVYFQKRVEYFQAVPRQILKEINKRRLALGKLRIHPPPKHQGKQSTNAFFRFLADYRKTVSFTTLQEFSRMAGDKWKSLSEEEKAPYLEASAKAKAALAAANTP